MEERVQTYVFHDRAEPKRRIIRNDVALYIVVLLGVLASMFLASACEVYFGWSVFVVQIVLYAAIAVLIYFLYRFRLMSFAYLLTERMFSVTKVIGKKERPDVGVHLSDIVKITSFAEAELPKKKYSLYHGKKKDTTVLLCRNAGNEFAVLISPGDEMKTKLLEQWKQVRKKK